MYCSVTPAAGLLGSRSENVPALESTFRAAVWHVSTPPITSVWYTGDDGSDSSVHVLGVPALPTFAQTA